MFVYIHKLHVRACVRVYMYVRETHTESRDLQQESLADGRDRTACSILYLATW